MGQHLIATLQQAGYTNIRSFQRSECEPLQDRGVEVVRGNLTDFEAVKEAVRGCEAVFHTAAKAGVWGPYRTYHATNVLGTEHILKACHYAGTKFLIYTSSPSVVFKGHPLANANEHEGYGAPKKMCAYARTKMLAEQQVLTTPLQGLKTIALRPHLIYGPGDRHLIPTLIQAARKGQLCQVGTGKNWVDISYVTDVAHAHLLALEALQQNPDAVSGRAYFISQGDPIQLWPWINELLRKLQLPPVRRSLSLPMACLLSGCFEAIYKIFCIKQQPPMTRFIARELALDHYFDISAAKMDLHYIPKVSNEEGLELLAQWLRQG